MVTKVWSKVTKFIFYFVISSCFVGIRGLQCLLCDDSVGYYFYMVREYGLTYYMVAVFFIRIRNIFLGWLLPCWACKKNTFVLINNMRYNKVKYILFCLSRQLAAIFGELQSKCREKKLIWCKIVFILNTFYNKPLISQEVKIRLVITPANSLFNKCISLVNIGSLWEG